MANFLLILVCLLFGVLLRKTRIAPRDTPAALNAVVIYFALPALVALKIHELSRPGVATLYPILMPWIFFALSIPFFVILGRSLSWSRKTMGALILTGGLANTSFVGYPLIEAFYGHDALGTAVLLDQGGSFMCLATGGMFVASYFSARQSSLVAVVKRVVLFPPFLALLFALFTRGIRYPAGLETILNPVSELLVPLALISVGFQMELQPAKLKSHNTPLAIGLLYKLALGPLAILLIYKGLLHFSDTSTFRVILLEAAMAPMITGGILAAEYQLDPELASSMVAVGIPLSFLTVYLWSLVAKNF